MSMGKGGGGGGGGYKYIHPGRHTCAFHTAEFNDLLNTKTRKRNHQNIRYMVVSMVSTRIVNPDYFCSFLRANALDT